MSEQNAELTSGESGSLGAGPAVPPSPEASIQPVVAAPDLVPGQGAAEADAPKAEAEVEVAKAETPKAETTKAETPKAEAPRFPGKVMIMSAGERNWDDDSAALRDGIRAEPGNVRQAAGSPWPPWWRWRSWRARLAARWRPRVCRISSAATSRAPTARRWKPPSRGSTPTSWR